MLRMPQYFYIPLKTFFAWIVSQLFMVILQVSGLQSAKRCTVETAFKTPFVFKCLSLPLLSLLTGGRCSEVALCYKN